MRLNTIHRLLEVVSADTDQKDMSSLSCHLKLLVISGIKMLRKEMIVFDIFTFFFFFKVNDTEFSNVEFGTHFCVSLYSDVLVP